MRSLTAKQFRAWEIVNELDPFTEERDDYRFASIVQMLFNINRGKGQKALPLGDFVLKWAPEEKQKQTPEQQFAMLKILAAMSGGDASGQQPKIIITDAAPAELSELNKARLAMGVSNQL